MSRPARDATGRGAGVPVPRPGEPHGCRRRVDHAGAQEPRDRRRGRPRPPLPGGPSGRDHRLVRGPGRAARNAPPRTPAPGAGGAGGGRRVPRLAHREPGAPGRALGARTRELRLVPQVRRHDALRLGRREPDRRPRTPPLVGLPGTGAEQEPGSPDGGPRAERRGLRPADRGGRRARPEVSWSTRTSSPSRTTWASSEPTCPGSSARAAGGTSGRRCSTATRGPTMSTR